VSRRYLTKKGRFVVLFQEETKTKYPTPLFLWGFVKKFLKIFREFMAKIVKTDEKSRTLSAKQHAFVQNRAKGMNCVQAAQAAGYSIPDVQGYQVEKNPLVAEKLKKEWALAERTSEMSKKKVMDGMLYAIEQAKILADPSSQIAGWREVAKICGYYEPQKVKIEVSVSAKRMFSQFETLSDDELLKIAEEEIVDVDAVFVGEEGTDESDDTSSS
jgi:phage terminase small subunit